MKSKKANFSSIDDYIAAFPEDTQKIMQQLRKMIKAAAHTAEEKISYQNPEWYIFGLLCRVENSYCVLWSAKRQRGIQSGSVSLRIRSGYAKIPARQAHAAEIDQQDR